ACGWFTSERNLLADPQAIDLCEQVIASAPEVSGNPETAVVWQTEVYAESADAVTARTNSYGKPRYRTFGSRRSPGKPR
ncbi:MAG: hypothetical protein V3T72_03655, partial [Thermoanaerobaculia bacterium]